MQQQQQSNSRKVNLYYEGVYQRRNQLKLFILHFFFKASGMPRLVMEVFIRKSMGERYFGFGICVFTCILLALIPQALYGSFGHTFREVMARHWSWYAFLVVFLVFAWRRAQEIKREPSVFDFGKFSLSAGLALPFFFKVKVFDKFLTVRQISTYGEPLIFFVPGLLLFSLGHLLGMLFMVCAVVYSLGYMGAYRVGDDYVMDIIDDRICNEEIYNSFVMQKKPEETRGFQFMGNGPSAFEMREQLAHYFVDDDEEPAAFVR
jgi:hypothetical protein